MEKSTFTDAAAERLRIMKGFMYTIYPVGTPKTKKQKEQFVPVFVNAAEARIYYDTYVKALLPLETILNKIVIHLERGSIPLAELKRKA